MELSKIELGILKMPVDSSRPGQKSILGFFQRGTPGTQQSKSPTPTSLNGTKKLPIGSPKKQSVNRAFAKSAPSLTPAPSSDAVVEEEDEDVAKPSKPRKQQTGLPSPVTPVGLDGALDVVAVSGLTSSPSRKVALSLRK